MNPWIIFGLGQVTCLVFLAVLIVLVSGLENFLCYLKLFISSPSRLKESIDMHQRWLEELETRIIELERK